ATSEFENFTWSKADYGISLPVNYILEMDTSGTFTNPESLANTAGTSTSFTVEDFNDAVLAFGKPAFTESTVNLRVKAVVSGADVEILYSAPITRTITTYRLSNCGNYCAIGLIGDASAGGWGTDTDMVLADPTGVDKYTWTLTTFLNVGSVKFRADDDWAVNWGAADFPAGTGIQDGANIPIATAGYYKIVFDDKTGNYTVTALAGDVYTTIGVIGDATPGGWGADTDLTQDANNVHIWSGTVTLTDGEIKFRAENDWAVNWGSDTYPSGYGIGNGPNIPVMAGTYTLYFNDVSGQYFIMNNATPFTTIGVIGDATPGGWGDDTDLIQDPTNPYLWSGFVTLGDGEIKFRAENDWADNWGASDFPKGKGIQNGPNIPVKGGKYFISFNSGTGEYNILN
ncbi:MAG: SusF/SusE family outer membrane protein, partial [Cyclobacteriaceae bacterium]|nr:SusF/SusE family outer membrane protein [Cyclobacteriaceae bacterium]